MLSRSINHFPVGKLAGHLDSRNVTGQHFYKPNTVAQSQSDLYQPMIIKDAAERSEDRDMVVDACAGQHAATLSQADYSMEDLED